MNSTENKLERTSPKHNASKDNVIIIIETEEVYLLSIYVFFVILLLLYFPYTVWIFRLYIRHLTYLLGEASTSNLIPSSTQTNITTKNSGGTKNGKWEVQHLCGNSIGYYPPSSWCLPQSRLLHRNYLFSRYLLFHLL